MEKTGMKYVHVKDHQGKIQVLLLLRRYTHTPRNQSCFKITSVLHGIVGKWQSTEQLVLLFFLVFRTPAQI